MILTTNAQNTDFTTMIEAATKAPSGHNTQPWLFKINGDSITILPNLKETLAVVDKTNRELFISLGAATENLCIEASRLGYNNRVEIDPDAKSIVVHLNKADVEKDSLADAISKRQTNRKVYTGKIISKDTIDLLTQIATPDNIQKYIISKDDSLFKVLRTYVERGNRMQMEDPYFKEELLKYIRFNRKQDQENPTGLSYKTMESPSLPEFIAKPIVKSYLKPNKQNKSDLKKIDSSSHLVLFTSKNNSFEDWINMGRSLERFILTTTQLGIANAYMNQPCEVEPLANEMRSDISLINSEYPTLLLRIGYAEHTPYSSRKSVENVIIKD